ncbi:MAG: stage II sporulation protein P [Clostridia bacterium]|nr:stage II sporulation protein P [Clostridia bacterium]
MRRRLTYTQREKIKKRAVLALAVIAACAAFAAVPYIASALPEFRTARDRALPGEPDFPLGGGTVFAITQRDYSPQTSAPGDPAPQENDLPQEKSQSAAPAPQRGETDLPVFAQNLCWYSGDEPASLYVINRTAYTVTPEKYLAEPFPFHGRITEAPLVLIVHTHGSESYLPAGCDFYSPEETFRSPDDESTAVVHIGDVLCESLNALGIPALHDRTMYDITDFNKAYTYSGEAVKQALKDHPTIRFVIDLHRDSIVNSDGENIKPLTEINGENCAQIMLVVGTDGGGSYHPGWRTNMTVAAHLQQTLNDIYPTLARPMNIRTAAFNQALCPGSLLLECGSCANTLEEAENAIKLFAEAYAFMIKEEFEK